jgi:hypothetical protein
VCDEFNTLKESSEEVQRCNNKKDTFASSRVSIQADAFLVTNKDEQSQILLKSIRKLPIVAFRTRLASCKSLFRIMNEIARQVLGVTNFLSFKARDAVMVGSAAHWHGDCDCRVWSILIEAVTVRQAPPCKRQLTSRKAALQRNRRLLLEEYIYDPCIDDDDDDETASTISTADDSSCCSSDCLTSTSTTRTTLVSFDTPLVSAVYVRPYTTLQEKRLLYYTDLDYREFRRDYFYRPRGDRLVQFQPTLVTAVYSVPAMPEDATAEGAVAKSDLYYSEADLQGYVFMRATNVLSFCIQTFDVLSRTATQSSCFSTHRFLDDFVSSLAATKT